MKSALRHLQRQCVLKALFAKDQSIEGVYSNYIDYAIEEFGQDLIEVEFAKDLYQRSLESESYAFELIAEFAPNWPVDKLPPIDRNILLIGITELTTESQVPHLVAINEAVELAKEFGDENSSKFINAVLSNIAEKKLNLELKNKDESAKISSK